MIERDLRSACHFWFETVSLEHMLTRMRRHRQELATLARGLLWRADLGLGWDWFSCMPISYNRGVGGQLHEVAMSDFRMISSIYSLFWTLTRIYHLTGRTVPLVLG